MNNFKTTFERIDDIEDCVGKTIAAVRDTYEAIGLRFTDNTYYCAAAQGDDDDAYMESRHFVMETKDALNLGIIDQAEFNRAEQQAKDEAMAEELKHLNRLKAKYEPRDKPTT